MISDSSPTWTSPGLKRANRGEETEIHGRIRRTGGKGRVAEDKAIQQTSSRHSVHPNQMSRWKRKADEGLVELFEKRLGASRRSSRPRSRSFTRRAGNRWWSGIFYADSGTARSSARSSLPLAWPALGTLVRRRRLHGTARVSSLAGMGSGTPGKSLGGSGNHPDSLAAAGTDPWLALSASGCT